jgi:hypothetical protein
MRKWWIVLSVVASLTLTGCGDTGGGSNQNGIGTLGANQFFSTPAHLQPLEESLAYVGVRFVPITTTVNGQQVTAPGIDTQYFAQAYRGAAQAQGPLTNYEYAVQNTLNSMNLDNQTFFTLNVKLNLVQGLLQLGY